MIACAEPNRRRNFWTTQPDACGKEPLCDTDCGRPGLLLTAPDCASYRCDCCADPVEGEECIASHRMPAAQTPRSIVTTEWLRSLILNILYTDGRLPDTKCGYAPGMQGGHWSESYREDGQKVGSLVRSIGLKASFRDAVIAIKAQLDNDLARLVIMKLASSVDVTVTYIGGMRVRADIVVTGNTGESARVGLLGARNTNTWAWT